MDLGRRRGSAQKTKSSQRFWSKYNRTLTLNNPTVGTLGPTLIWINELVGLTRDMPFHLLFPLVAGLLYVIGSLFTKHASNGGLSSWTVAVFANFCATVFMSAFWCLGGNEASPMSPSQMLSLLWQPALIGALYVTGQVLILSAVTYGDVSVALPVASVKVIIVAVMLFFLTAQPPSAATWSAAGLAAIGVFLINFVAPKSDKARIMVTVILSVLGVIAFALFDVCIQSWSPAWGTGRMLPFSFWFAGLFTLPLLPKADSLKKILGAPWKSLLLSGTFLAGQAMFMVYGLSAFGDAANMNVVYSLRGLWAVVLAWMFAKSFGGAEARLPLKTMVARVCGAAMLVLAVIVTIRGQ